MNAEAITRLNYTLIRDDDLQELGRDCLYEAPYTAYIQGNMINLLENSVNSLLRTNRVLDHFQVDDLCLFYPRER